MQCLEKMVEGEAPQTKEELKPEPQQPQSQPPLQAFLLEKFFPKSEDKNRLLNDAVRDGKVGLVWKTI
jgi:hypothetical protein